MDASPADRLRRVAANSTLTLTHIGRTSGKPYQVTIWFMVDGDRLFLPTADVNRSWVRNVRKTPRVQLAIGEEKFEADAQMITDDRQRDHVFALVGRKYWYAFPMILLARLLIALGLRKDTSGAFEATLRQS
ncbi:MAG TPA: nitroreductase family deazaflavin-dependent oxidoreductase [Candidatus Binataceae bacterium]|nr:nitroreductase family deazaflavin-dependent oxidoreductase [Candidatus Binataceae bacterium]